MAVTGESSVGGVTPLDRNRTADKPATPATPNSSNGSGSGSEQELRDQVSQLQKDLKSIAATLSGLAGDKVADAQSVAKKELGNLTRAGQEKVAEVQDEFGHLEQQLKDTIRQKPLTAVAGALALGFLIAVITR